MSTIGGNSFLSWHNATNNVIPSRSSSADNTDLASGVSGTSGAGGASGASGASGAAGASGVSGASGSTTINKERLASEKYDLADCLSITDIGGTKSHTYTDPDTGRIVTITATVTSHTYDDKGRVLTTGCKFKVTHSSY